MVGLVYLGSGERNIGYSLKNLGIEIHIVMLLEVFRLFLVFRDSNLIYQYCWRCSKAPVMGVSQLDSLLKREPGFYPNIIFLQNKECICFFLKRCE